MIPAIQFQIKRFVSNFRYQNSTQRACSSNEELKDLWLKRILQLIHLVSFISRWNWQGTQVYSFQKTPKKELVCKLSCCYQCAQLSCTQTLSFYQQDTHLPTEVLQLAKGISRLVSWLVRYWWKKPLSLRSLMTVTWRKVGSTLSSRGDQVKLNLKDLKNAPVQNSRLERRVFVVGFAVLWERKQAI